MVCSMKAIKQLKDAENVFLKYFIVFNFGAGPSKYIMVTSGNQSPYVPHFFSLAPKKHPLPSCLNGTKQAIAYRYKAALFPGEGMYQLHHRLHSKWSISTLFFGHKNKSLGSFLDCLVHFSG